MLVHALVVHSFLLFRNLFIVYPVDGHLDCFQFLATMNKMINKTCPYKFLCEHMFHFLLGKYLGVELLGSTVSLCLTF